MSNNGFVDAQNMLKKIKVDSAAVKRAQRAAADIYVHSLRPALPSDPKASFVPKYGQMKNNLKVIQSGADIAVTFGDSFWWKFVDKGTPKITAKNFTRNTLKAAEGRMNSTMIKMIKKEMGI